MKRKIGMRLALVGMSLGLMVLTIPALGADGDSKKGKQVYQQYCLACHGMQGKGDGPVAMSIKPPPANLAGEMVKNKPDSYLFNVIRKGKKGTAMPAWENDLSEQQINDVVEYVRSLGK